MQKCSDRNTASACVKSRHRGKAFVCGKQESMDRGFAPVVKD